MSRIWDALQKVEELRDAADLPRLTLTGRLRLTPKQRVAIHALLRTATIEEAAAAAGVTETTLHRWLGKPGFVSEYYLAGRREIEDAMMRLDTATGTALSVLEQAREILTAVRRRAGARDRIASNGTSDSSDGLASATRSAGDGAATG